MQTNRFFLGLFSLILPAVLAQAAITPVTITLGTCTYSDSQLHQSACTPDMTTPQQNGDMVIVPMPTTNCTVTDLSYNITNNSAQSIPLTIQTSSEYGYTVNNIDQTGALSTVLSPGKGLTLGYQGLCMTGGNNPNLFTLYFRRNIG